jgi:outer membrane immunogenic protein
MKRLLPGLIAAIVLATTHAFAADLWVPPPMPYKAPPPVPYVYNWSGLYVGGEAGFGWASSTSTIVTNPPAPAEPRGTVENPTNYTGPLGGIYGGYNFQFSNIVVGIDGDYTWSGLTGTSLDTNPANGHITTHNADINWISTATGRLGYANNNWLFFAKGGWAWADYSASDVETTAAGAKVGIGNAASTREGWTVGGGVEMGLTPNLTAKLEYDYVKFQTANINANELNLVTGSFGVFQRTATSYLDMIKVGLDYKFNWAAR